MNKQIKIVENFFKEIVKTEPKYVGYHTVVSITGKIVGINGSGEKPYWSDENKCWMYETTYGLGGTSFGCIREQDIRRLANDNEYP
jgi:hypothetical protein